MEDVISVFIPIIAILFPAIILFIIFYFVFTTDYKKEKLKREERIKAIEAGVEVPPEPVAPPSTPLDHLRRGLICLGIGLGLLIGSWLAAGKIGGDVRSYFQIGGFIVAFIGIALVIFYKIQSKSEK
jgi:hypothetical protein